MDEGTERLMPWRTLFEVCKIINQQQGYNSIIVSSTDIEEVRKRDYQFVEIIEIPKGNASFTSILRKIKLDVLFFPISWRDGLKQMNFLKDIKCIKIAYIPGGIYSVNGVLSLMKEGGLSIAKPYILECIIPKRLIIHTLKATGFSKIIALTNHTANYILNAGWQHSHIKVTLPGNDTFNELESDNSILKGNHLAGKKFFLFTGAPAVIRGSTQLLKAFDILAEQNSEVQLVFLMRTDNHSKYDFFEKKLALLHNKDRIIVLRDKLSPQQLKSFIISSRAVILPFLLIPSEIPLTYFEVLSCGTPIITYKNGGTYDYIQNAVLGGKPGNISELSKMMEKLWTDDILCKNLSDTALRLMKEHPNWEDTGRKWLQAIEN